MDRNIHPFIHYYKGPLLCSGSVLLYDTFIVMKSDKILCEVEDSFHKVMQRVGLCVWRFLYECQIFVQV